MKIKNVSLSLMSVIKVILVVALISWIASGPLFVQGGSLHRDGDWTSYEKGRVIELLEQIAENTGGG